MLKITGIIAVLSIAIISCADNNGSKEAPKKSGSEKTGTRTEDSYANDTFYQALPALLQDVSEVKDMEDLLAQNWILEDDKLSLQDAGNSSLEMPVRTLSMSKDYSIIRNVRNSMETGTWKFDANKKTISLNFTGGAKDLYKIRALAADEMKLTNVGIGSETVLKFVTDAKRQKLAENDPFSIGNNKWRIKPRASENDEAIRQRLKDNLHFFILYYRDVIARRDDVVSFYGFPSCVNWYNAGIGMQDKDKVDENWEDCFYNKAQAMKAYTLLDDALKKKYTWPKGEVNWIKKNLFILEQLYQQL
jgi:hypothetical protein